MKAAAIKGGLRAIALAFSFATVCALVYGFPVPIGGYLTGPIAKPGALLAVVSYGVLGGFPALLQQEPWEACWPM